MFDRFTAKARKVLGHARQEAQRFLHDYIGTEHLLLGLLRQDSGVAADILGNLDMAPERIHREIERVVSRGTTMVTMGQLPLTREAGRVLELALEEADALGQNEICTGHLLFRLTSEPEGVAGKVLRKLQVRPSEVHDRNRRNRRREPTTRRVTAERQPTVSPTAALLDDLVRLQDENLALQKRIDDLEARVRELERDRS